MYRSFEDPLLLHSVIPSGRWCTLLPVVTVLLVEETVSTAELTLDVYCCRNWMPGVETFDIREIVCVDVLNQCVIVLGRNATITVTYVRLELRRVGKIRLSLLLLVLQLVVALAALLVTESLVIFTIIHFHCFDVCTCKLRHSVSISL